MVPMDDGVNSRKDFQGINVSFDATPELLSYSGFLIFVEPKSIDQIVFRNCR